MEIGLILTALLSGGFIGAVLGFIGAGGAMVSVPILIYQLLERRRFLRL